MHGVSTTQPATDSSAALKMGRMQASRCTMSAVLNSAARCQTSTASRARLGAWR